MTAPIRFSVQASVVNDPVAFRELASKAEDLGYSTISMADHVADGQLAPMIALMAAADATTTLRVMSLVLGNDYRHPGLVAREAASVDLLSGGRLELGLGAGWMQADYDQLGVAYERPGTRIERLEEAVGIVDRLLRGETVHHVGEHYRIDGLTGFPLPHQQPRPPLLVAGGGRRILSVAARTADIIGLNPGLGAGVIDHRAGPSATPDATDQKLAWIRAAAGDRFDDLVFQTRIHMAAISDDREQMAEVLAPGLGVSPADALASPHALVGSVAQCVENVLEWRERWGISYIGLSADAIDDFAPVVAALS
ncbi:MAG: TIGR03621 family F420-dependent LLM class oxidoreductase [Acidimicrobiales bacterium]